MPVRKGRRLELPDRHPEDVVTFRTCSVPVVVEPIGTLGGRLPRPPSGRMGSLPRFGEWVEVLREEILLGLMVRPHDQRVAIG